MMSISRSGACTSHRSLPTSVTGYDARSPWRAVNRVSGFRRRVIASPRVQDRRLDDACFEVGDDVVLAGSPLDTIVGEPVDVALDRPNCPVVKCEQPVRHLGAHVRLKAVSTKPWAGHGLRKLDPKTADTLGCGIDRFGAGGDGRSRLHPSRVVGRIVSALADPCPVTNVSERKS